MPHSYGIRARTATCSPGEHGMPIKPDTYLNTCKAGDIANAAIHRGMPYKFYRTGVVYNVTKSDVGIIVNEMVENRFVEKRVNIRMEHIKHSKCRDDFLRRVKEKAAAKLKAKSDGVKINLERQLVQPRSARHVSAKLNTPATLTSSPTTLFFKLSRIRGSM
ncbi:MAG: ribosomal protein L21e-domain-containing protein [Benniella sp.]|nr:MAG: ribosomal protein L21e-domain-containing protein [Benniella sp.]